MKRFKNNAYQSSLQVKRKTTSFVQHVPASLFASSKTLLYVTSTSTNTKTSPRIYIFSEGAGPALGLSVSIFEVKKGVEKGQESGELVVSRFSED